MSSIHAVPIPEPHHRRRVLRLPQWRLPAWASFWVIVLLALLVGLLAGMGLRQAAVDHARERAVACDRAAIGWRTVYETDAAIPDTDPKVAAAQAGLIAKRLTEAQEAWLGCYAP